MKLRIYVDSTLARIAWQKSAWSVYIWAWQASGRWGRRGKPGGHGGDLAALQAQVE